MCLIALKPQFYVVLPRKSPSKLALGKISYVNFYKFVDKVDNSRQGALPCDTKLK